MISIILIIIILIIMILLQNKNKYIYKPVKHGDFKKYLTILDVFKQTAKKYKRHPSIKVRRKNIWKFISYGEYYKQCKKFAKSLLANNVKSPVLIIGHNAPGWFFAYLGSMMVGVVPVGIYPTTKKHACQKIVQDCNPEVLVVENASQLKKFVNMIASKKSKIRMIITYSSAVDITIEEALKIPIYTWGEFIEQSKKYNNEKKFKSIKIFPNRIATIIYTSGTTGKPKGVMISHQNITSMANMIIKQLCSPPKSKSSFDSALDSLSLEDDHSHVNLEYGKERIVSYLPLNHITAQLLDIFIPLYTAATVYIADNSALKSSLYDTLQTAKPTLFAAVPRIWEKMAEAIENKHMNLSLIERIFIDLSGNIIDIFNNTAIKKLGLDVCKYAITTAAPISQNTMDYFSDMGIQLHNIYGMSETTGPISVSTPRYNRRGSVGKILSDIDIKILNKEILVKGPSVFGGYYRNYKDTKTAFDSDGWFYTGDMGYVDKDGYLYITGREKDIIITSGGEIVSPVSIENTVKDLIPLVDHAVVIGDRKKYLSLLLTLKLEVTSTGEPTVLFTKEAKNILKLIGSESQNSVDVTDDSQIKQYIDNGIKEVNKLATSNVHTIKKWVILPIIFTEKSGELTPTMKLKRRFIYKKYKDYIDGLYE